MDARQLVALRETRTRELSIWYDRMFELTPAQLIETVLFHMEPDALEESLDLIKADILEAERYDDAT